MFLVVARTVKTFFFFFAGRKFELQKWSWSRNRSRSNNKKSNKKLKSLKKVRNFNPILTSCAATRAEKYSSYAKNSANSSVRPPNHPERTVVKQERNFFLIAKYEREKKSRIIHKEFFITRYTSNWGRQSFSALLTVKAVSTGCPNVHGGALFNACTYRGPHLIRSRLFWPFDRINRGVQLPCILASPTALTEEQIFLTGLSVKPD